MSIFSDSLAAAKRELGIFFGFIDEPRERFLVTSPEQVTAKFGNLTITEPGGKRHVFCGIDVCDLYFWRLRQQPDQADLMVWILPAEEAHYHEYQELYAGTFVVGSAAQDHAAKLIEQLGWELTQR